MVYQFKLQVPISEELNRKLKAKAKSAGFSSVNEIARLLLTNFANGNLSLFFGFGSQRKSQEYVEIADHKLEKIIEEGLMEFERGETKTLDFAKPLSEQLLKD